MAKTVILKDGTKLTGKAARDYGKTPAVEMNDTSGRVSRIEARRDAERAQDKSTTSEKETAWSRLRARQQGEDPNAPPGTESTFGDEEARLTRTLADVGTAPSKEDILRNKTKEANSAADLIREQFNAVIAGEQRAGERRSDRTRALNVSAGLVGSDFATAAAEKTEGDTRAVIQAKESERDAKILELLTGVASKADEQYAKEAEAFRTKAEQGLTAVKNFRESTRTQATNVLSAIAASGAAFETVKKSPQYAAVLDAFGGDENQVKGAFLASVPEQDKLGSTTVGNKYVTFYRDPVTGKQSTVEFELPIAPGGNEEVQSVMSNGQILMKRTSKGADGSVQSSFEIVSPKGWVDKSTGGGDGSGDIFSPDEERDVRKAGLANADQQTRVLFTQTNPKFQQEYIRNGFGNREVTPDILLRNYEEWEANNSDDSDSGNPY